MKRFISFFLVIVCVFSLSGCSEPEKLDYNLLSERLSKIDSRYGFDFFDMIYYDDAYHVFINLVNKDDVVLSMTNSDGAVTSVTLTGSSSNLKGENAYREYVTFVENLLSTFAYADQKTVKTVVNELGIYNTADFFRELQQEYTFDRYKCTFTSNNLFITFCCEYFQEEEISSQNTER